jgi:hypothetical protein
MKNVNGGKKSPKDANSYFNASLIKRRDDFYLRWYNKL